MWFLVTMDRPERCQAALDSMIACEIETPGYVVVNGPLQVEKYRQLRLPKDWGLIELPENIGICGALNLMFKRFPDEPWYGMPCDDELVFERRFDRWLIREAGAWNISHGNDGWRSQYRLWTYATFGGDLLRACGYWALPGLWHWYFDDHWELIAKEFGLKRHCEGIRTEHRHTDNGAVDLDATYQAGRANADSDRRRFEQWKREEWPSLRARIAQAKQ